jgi:hypothetical protein
VTGAGGDEGLGEGPEPERELPAALAERHRRLYVAARHRREIESRAERSRPSCEHDGLRLGLGLVERDVQIGQRLLRNRVLLAIVHRDQRDVILQVDRDVQQETSFLLLEFSRALSQGESSGDRAFFG